MVLLHSVTNLAECMGSYASVMQEAEKQGPEHDGLGDIRQGLAAKPQAEAGNDDAVMQSAVSVCEGALGILKAALAGNLTGNQSVSMQALMNSKSSCKT